MCETTGTTAQTEGEVGPAALLFDWIRRDHRREQHSSHQLLLFTTRTRLRGRVRLQPGPGYTDVPFMALKIKIQAGAAESPE